MHQKNKRKRVLIKFLTFMLFAAFVSLFAGRTIAKYITSMETDGYTEAKEFYFTSDALSETGMTHTLNSGTTEFQFTVGNYADNLRFSEVDIEYNVVVDSEENDQVSIDYSGSNRHLLKNEKQDDTITIKGLNTGCEYTITVTAKGGYEKILTGTIIVRADGGIYQYQKDMGEYLLVTVWSEGATGTANIVYSAGLIPDNTNPNMSNWQKGETEKTERISLGASESKVFRFFGDGTVTVKTNGNESVPTKELE